MENIIKIVYRWTVFKLFDFYAGSFDIVTYWLLPLNFEVTLKLLLVNLTFTVEMLLLLVWIEYVFY